ncbi:MAG: bifunctional diguanylate cyclase/phosphodiesterase, partial [Clostridiales bacterium]|nr:bifunctional diguanylate cyclase/phosphodiesterase [Clostridiales bacterium]
FMIGCINEVGKHQIADNQSGLMMSAALKDSIDKILAECPNGYVLCVGIDDFQTIIERIGTTEGEKITRAFADCIRHALTSGQQVYRMELDEFLVVDYNGGTAQQAKLLYHKIRTLVDDWIEKDDYEIVYTISGGIVMGSDMEGDDYDSIIKKAQFSLHQAELLGKNTAYRYDRDDYVKFVEEREILLDMKKAVSNNFERFEVYYQPIMESGEKLYAAESLLRFTTADGRQIPPSRFIPLLEESGLIIPVGRWVLDQALSTCKECQKYKPDFKVSVNFSYVQILKTNVCDEVINVLREHGLSPESLIVEMTESGPLEESPSVQKVWDDFRESGILLAIDDFGTGYSNLSSIGMIMPNIVKLDRGFTVKAMKNSYEKQLMDHVIQLVHSIDLKICVEGVETPSELDTIERLNADCIQGYYYGKPCARHIFMENFICA